MSHPKTSLLVRDPLKAAVTEPKRAAFPTSPQGPAPRQTRPSDNDGYASRIARQAVSQWWKPALLVGIVLAASASAVAFYLFQPVYRASALLQIEENAPFVVDQVGPVSSRYVPTQIEILRSRIVLESVVSDPAVADLPELQEADEGYQSLLQRLRFSPVGASELYEVSCDAYTAHNAQRLTNRVVDSYFAYRAQSETERTKRVIELLDAERGRRERKLDDLRARFRELGERAAKAGSVSDASMSSSVESSLTGVGGSVPSSLQDRITLAQVEQQVLQAKLDAMQGDRTSEVTLVMQTEVEAELADESQVRLAEEAIAERYAALQRTAAIAAGGTESEVYQRTSRELTLQKSQLDELKESLRPAIRNRLELQALAAADNKRRELRSNLESFRLMEQTLMERRNQQLTNRGAASSLLVALEFARAELEQEESSQKMLAERATSLRTELDAPEQVSLLRHAEVPFKPLSPLPWKQLLVGVFGGLGFPFALAIGFEMLARRVRSREQLEHTFDSPVVAEIASLPKSADQTRAILLADDDEQVYLESIDRLSASLMLSGADGPRQVLATASAVSGEGKTRTAVQLAMSIARLQKTPVLLVDCDLRRPDVHQILGIEMSPGLADVIEGRCTFDEAVFKLTETLHVLPAGHCVSHPRDLLGESGFEDAMSLARQHYSRVVMDTPPLLPASEALYTARAADGVILCAKRDHSRERSIRKAFEDLLATGVRPLGMVLSGIPRKQYSSSYGTYSYNRQPTQQGHSFDAS